MTAKSVPMQYEDKFHALARAVEVTEEEMQIAKFFWYAGLRHAFQRGTSSPALLEKPTSVFDMKFGASAALPSNKPAHFCNLSKEKREQAGSQFTFVDKTYESHTMGFFEQAGQQCTDDRTLTPYEAKMLQLVLSDILSELQDEIKGVQTYINFIWKDCDPADKRTEETFKEMNKMKDIVRKSKKHVATLNNAQRKLKKIAKGT